VTSEMLAQTVAEIGSFLLVLVVVTLWTCVLLRRDKVRRDRVEREARS